MSKTLETSKETPLMAQYLKVKAKYPDAILLFRVGDFYETFGQDAVTTSKVLSIVLTARNNGSSQIELAGFPHHALDMYLPKLVRAGYRVAICDQLEKPNPQKKIVKRGVTEVVTPGVTSLESLLDNKSSNYLASVVFGKNEQTGLAFLDISTGEFLVSEGDRLYTDKLLRSFQPSEVIFSKDKSKLFEKEYGDKFYTFPLDEWIFTLDYGRQKLLEHYEVASLKGFGIEDLDLSQIAAGAVLHYLSSTENKNLRHITTVSRILPDRYVWLDRFTIHNLELLVSNHDTGTPLLRVLDQTITPMGARLMRKWVVLPLKSIPEIESRLDTTQYFIENQDFSKNIEAKFRIIGDLERLISKVPLGKISPREAVHLAKALAAIEEIKRQLSDTRHPIFEKIAENLNPCPRLQGQIQMQIVPEPPANLTKGGVIADGYSEELDDLRNTVAHAQDLLLQIQQSEAQRTGITNLKIGFNSVFGYYLEVTNKYKHLAPQDWIRKQTISNGDRYVTDELKKLEAKILGAEEKILDLEERLFQQLLLDMADYIQPIQHNAALLARLDCLIAFAKISIRYHYCRPEINDSLTIDIRDGRHPVIETQLPLGEAYVPNDVLLDHDNQQVLLITGPNMSGKSALLRQTALICLMAQMGCYVPAASAKIGYVDKVFTRVGASDNISSGESTFMVEMNETSSIMNNISDRSVILLDEIGRGTSTYDGISIAWSIAEYLHNNGFCRPKTLFATHYHELNELENKFSRIKNFNIAVREVGYKVLFLRKLVPGGSEHSFGIHVARMAGMPRSIVERAKEILAQMETKFIDSEKREESSIPLVHKPETQQIAPAAYQLSIFETVDQTAGKLKDALKDMNVNTMTPIECMLKLIELKKMLDEE
jgi:DNA mismatch repair protein MutS